MEISKILKGEFDNHILPFLWIHGESEEVYRTNIQAIYNANIRAFCVEARPHKEFCQDGWWSDLAIILDEAKKLGMKVWILDDKHFPTGYAAGAVETAPARLRRQSVLMKQVKVKSGKVRINLKSQMRRKISFEQTLTDVLNKNGGKNNRFSDNRVISVTAINKKTREYLDISNAISGDKLCWTVQEGEWTINICYLSRNCGSHRSYMNMMDMESCQLLISEVYEKHFEHFGDMFGDVIAGFFSDEPELGNGFAYHMHNFLGTSQDLPWSAELEKRLYQLWGEDFEKNLPLLWLNKYGENETAKVRYEYMDQVSTLVEECFSKQVGMWCRNHGVEYIGHIIEDNNQHARTGTSLGHYFRGLKYQSMAGIDIIGNSLYPQREVLNRHNFIWKKEPSDGEFYHFGLAKLGSSLGQLNPEMKDRTMCELFGNYGWEEGVRLEKFLIDHCLVRGINYFVPHAFDCKEYPDKDCPPHFYADGNDPLYRHFGELMGYTNRITSLFDGKQVQTPAAILYHGEAEWCNVYSGERANPETSDGKDALREGYMLMQKPARVLQENQIDFHFVPADAFSDREFYQTKITDQLIINGKAHKMLIVPYARFITKATAEAIVEFKSQGGKVVFIEGYPIGLCEGGQLPQEIKNCDMVRLDDLKQYMQSQQIAEIRLDPAAVRMRAMYMKSSDGEGLEAVMLVNEDDSFYNGAIDLPWEEDIVLYDPWNNKLIAAKIQENKVKICLKPSESTILLHGAAYIETDVEELENEEAESEKEERELLHNFQVSICRSIDYPKFEPVTKLNPKFSGFLRYENQFTYNGENQVKLTITDANEGVEVFVNGSSTGIQILPPMEYDITSLCVEGSNQICIEVATTLERENSKNVKDAVPVGITGDVILSKFTKI
ncbi:MAG: hypothetical protein Q4B26_12895 [Eubacteriales bacterium]|nr:hypothetical protein [Eubacteriales bacterium]